MIFSYQFKELQASSLSLSKDGRLNFSLNIRKKVETCDIKHLDIFQSSPLLDMASWLEGDILHSLTWKNHRRLSRRFQGAVDGMLVDQVSQCNGSINYIRIFYFTLKNNPQQLLIILIYFNK